MPIAVKIATTTKEREAIFRFRYHVYVNELKLQQERADHQRQWLHDPYGDVQLLILPEAAIGQERSRRRILFNLVRERQQLSPPALMRA